MDNDFLQYGGNLLNLPSMIMLVVLLVAAVVEVVGIFYFTQIVFFNSRFQPTPTKFLLMKVTVVLLWLGVVYKVLAGLGLLGMFNM